MACISNPVTSLPSLSTDEIIEMVDKARTSTDALSDYDSAGSTISSVWESSEPDISDSEGEGKDTDFSGSSSPSEPLTPVDHSVDRDRDTTQESSSIEQEESNISPPALACQYNLRSKREASSTSGPPAKRPCYRLENECEVTKNSSDGGGQGGGLVTIFFFFPWEFSFLPRN